MNIPKKVTLEGESFNIYKQLPKERQKDRKCES